MNEDKLKILITRNREDAGAFDYIKTKINAEIIYFPALKIKTLRNRQVEKTFAEINRFDFVVFTSVNAVKSFLELKDFYKSSFKWKDIWVAATGAKTALFCSNNGIEVNFVPDEYSASGLLLLFESIDIKGKKILIPCSLLAGDELAEGLKKRNAVVTKIPIYNVVPPDIEEVRSLIDLTHDNKPDLFAFTSPSAFKNFIRLLNVTNLGGYFGGSAIAAIGNTTARAIENFGLNVSIVPEKFTLEFLSEAIVKYFQKKEEVG